MKTPTALANLSVQLTLLAEHWGQFLEAQLEHRPGPGRWSKKEILGHLIDSAANNHRRFVQAQGSMAQPLELVAYDQDAWAKSGAYQSLPPATLLALWTSYNQFLLHMLAQIPESALAQECHLLNNIPVTLDWLIDDYVLHLEHHVRQIIHEYV